MGTAALLVVSHSVLLGPRISCIYPFPSILLYVPTHEDEACSQVTSQGTPASNRELRLGRVVVSPPPLQSAAYEPLPRLASLVLLELPCQPPHTSYKHPSRPSVCPSASIPLTTSGPGWSNTTSSNSPLNRRSGVQTTPHPSRLYRTAHG